MEVNCETLAVMGSTLANGGVCPITSEAALGPEAVRDVLSLMHRYTFIVIISFVSLFYIEIIKLNKL